MAIIMLAFMLGMYNNKKLNVTIFLMAAVIFVACVYLVRSQSTVSDTAYMKAMIPFFTIPLPFLPASAPNIEDVRVRTGRWDYQSATKRN